MAKILLFGQAQFGERVLGELLARGHTLTSVSLPPDREGRPPDPLKTAAEKAGLRIVQRRSYKDREACDALDAASADLGVLAYVTQIIPVAVLDTPRLASICFHPSLLPAYRGGSAINWQIIRGETRSGVTLFRPDAGVDAGPIYLQREIAIGPDDSAGSFYYSKVFEPGIQATLDAVEMVLDGRAEPRVQDANLATHDPLCRDQHAGIDWSRPADELHNLVRGCDPAPGAHCSWQGQRLRLYGSRRAAEHCEDAPGTVLAIGDEGIEIATGSGSLRFAKLNAGRGKTAAAEVAASISLAAGSLLASAASPASAAKPAC